MKVKTGLEVLLEERLELLRRKRIGLIANPSSVNSRLQHVLDLFLDHPEIELTTVLGPQHGAYGQTQENMIEWEDHRDDMSGLPVFSLYGKTRVPTLEMLAQVDLLVFDLQDVGARYYTFIHTMALAMQACRRQGKSFLVLDRPNPIGGVELEGTVLDPRFRSFVGLYPLAIRHGMTTGELALYFDREFGIGCSLEVVEMQGWSRDLFFEDTRLPWIMPSPNMPSPETAFLYAGLCLLESTNVSEGRGTTRPFELSGAPWIEPQQLIAYLKGMYLPGTLFRPVRFIPTFHKWSGKMVGGVQVHVLDRKEFLPFRTGIALVKAYRELGGEHFQWKTPPYEYEYEKLPFDILCGNDRVRKLIEEDASLETIEQSWRQELGEFKELRRKYLLY